MKNCLNCGKLSKYEYCCADCLRAKVKDPHNLICKSCGKEFYYPNIKDIRYGRIKYCSSDCSHRKNNVNYNYFTEIDDFKLFTLGQIITNCNIYEKDFISIVNDEKTLLDISKKINCTKEMTDTNFVGRDKEYKRLKIDDYRFVLNCIDVDIHGDMMHQEFPSYKWQPIVDGMMSTIFFEEKNGYKYLTLFSSKLISQVRDFIGGEIFTKMQRDISNTTFLRVKYILRF